VPRLTFSETSYTQQTLTFVVPDDIAAAKLVIWKPAGSGIFAVDAISVRAQSSNTED